MEAGSCRTARTPDDDSTFLRHYDNLYVSTQVAALRRLSDNRTGRPLSTASWTRYNRYLNEAQLETIAKACGPYETLVMVLGYTGLRWGVAAALRVGRVDVLRGRLTIAENMVEVGGRTVFGTPKMHERRSVPVLPSLRRDLARACEGKGRDDFVFPGARGGVLRDNVFRRRYFNAAVEAAEVGPFTPHDLRDTAASFAISSGAHVKVVQRMLGHKSATLTLDRYAALFPDDLDHATDRMEGARQKSKISRSARGLSVVALDHEAREVASDLR